MQHTKRVVLTLGFALGLMGLFLYIPSLFFIPPAEPLIKVEPITRSFPTAAMTLKTGQNYKYRLVCYHLEPNLSNRTLGRFLWPVRKRVGTPLHGEVIVKEEISHTVKDLVYTRKEPYYIVETHQKNRIFYPSPKEFNFKGRLYLHANSGKILKIELPGTDPSILTGTDALYVVSVFNFFAPWYLELRKDFAISMRFGQDHISAKVAGIGKINGKDCFKVVATSSAIPRGAVIIQWVDVSTRTAVRQYLVYGGRIYRDFYLTSR